LEATGDSESASIRAEHGKKDKAMCGIAGIVDLTGLRTPRPEVVLRMNEELRHRGPDGGDVAVLPGLAFGHRRLAIIDLSDGAQPMTSSDGSMLVTYNGEIYNFLELRAQLAQLGHRFRTQSDTEILLEGWRAWGHGLLDRLRGMFAFALWDRREQILFLARDRLGEKPLYYARDDLGRLVFASEIEALVQALPGTPTLDLEAVADYLSLGYVPDPKAIWQGIRKLSPGHFLELHRHRPPTEPVRYWRPCFSPRHQGSLDELAVELRRRLDEAVRLRLMSDVPLGAFLSGGVDSSGVVALMARAGDDPVVTCSLGFPEPEFDETEQAMQIAELYCTDHRAQVVEVDACRLLDRVAGAMGEPFADSSALPTFLVSRLARQRVTVALSGDGGDELFAGYRRYPFHLREEQTKAYFPLRVRQSLFGTAARLWPKLDWAPRPLRAKATFEALAADTATAYLRAVTLFPAGDRNRVLAPEFGRQLGGYDPAALIAGHMNDAGTDDPLARAQYVDFMTWLPGRMLVKVDRASMAHGLEVRPPLLDHELVEWAAGLPATAKLRGRSGKQVLKRALEPLIPRELLAGQKRGFSVPLAQWLRHGLDARLEAVGANGRLADAGIVAPVGYRAVVEEHQRGVRNHGQLLWALLMLDAFLARADGGTRQPLAA
jgi:asparagine synthase (glutamine-hydrolysing)